MVTIRFYSTTSGRKPVEDFIEAEDKHTQEKFYELFSHLKIHGFHLPTQFLRRMSGTKSLWELRIKHQKQYRVFLARIDKDAVILLHAIIKKTQKTPQRDIETAENRLKDYEEQS